MEVLNVVLIYDGALDYIKSFKISAKTEKTRQKQIAKAEEYFKYLAKNDDKNLEDSEINDFVENGYYTDDNGYDLYLSWSQLE